jgi:hypothetical protein
MFVRLLQRFGCFKNEEKKEEKHTLPPLALDDETMQPALAHANSLKTLDSARLNTGVKRLSKMLANLQNFADLMKHLSGELDSVAIDATALQNQTNTIIEHIEKRPGGAKSDTMHLINSALLELNKIQSSPLFDTEERRIAIEGVQASLNEIKNKVQIIVSYQQKRESDIKEQTNTLENKLADLRVYLIANLRNAISILATKEMLRGDPMFSKQDAQWAAEAKEKSPQQSIKTLPSHELVITCLESALARMGVYNLGLMSDERLERNTIEIQSNANGLQYSVMSLDGEEKNGLIGWNQLQNFPTDASHIVAEQGEFLPTLLHITSEAGLTYEGPLAKGESVTQFCDEIAEILSPLNYMEKNLNEYLDVIRQFQSPSDDDEEKDEQENSVSSSHRGNR